MSNYGDWRDGFQSQIQELNLKEMKVDGHVPNWLSGAFISTGPGNFEIAEKHARHWFDGYALLKGFYFHQGKASFRNRLLISDTYIENEINNSFEKLNAFNDSQKIYIASRMEALKNSKLSFDNGNVNVCQLGNVGIAMTEVISKPTFNIHTLETNGHLNYEDALQAHIELAHPTFDPVSEKYINVAIKFGEKTEYIFYSFDVAKQRKLEVARYQADFPHYIHSFCVTENYFILIFSPVIFDLSNPEADFIDMLKYNEQLHNQFIVIHRSNQSVEKFTTSPFICFHQANAYEHGNSLVLDLCCYESKLSYETLLFDVLLNKPTTNPTYLTRYCINLSDKTLKNEKLSSMSCEFPRMNTKKYAGRGYSYNYLCLEDTNGNFLNGLMKINVQTGATQVWQQANCYCSEPIFVAKPGTKTEDDGVVLSIMFNGDKQISSLLIFNASDFSQIGQIDLPTFMPFGLHGDWFRLNN